MLTIFTTAKPFTGLDGLQQRNALGSWARLVPEPQILLMGDEEGYAEAARDVGARWVKDIAVNEKGTPLLDSMFRRADALAAHDTLAFVNADIVLMSDFARAVMSVQGLRHPFLLVGRTWDTPQPDPIEFDDPGWEADLRGRARARGSTHGSWWGIDYFVYRRGAYGGMRPFAVGRTGYDNWMIYHARSSGMRVVDASAVVDSVHQAHTYDSTGGLANIWHGSEAQANIALMKGDQTRFGICDATHVLTPRGIRPALGLAHLWRRAYNAPIVHPRLRFLRVPLEAARRATMPFRHRRGWTLDNFRRDG